MMMSKKRCGNFCELSTGKQHNARRLSDDRLKLGSPATLDHAGFPGPSFADLNWRVAAAS
jgi:hypothetical protein